MRGFVTFALGLAMLAVGTLKVWTHTQSLQAFLAVRCGPDGAFQSHSAHNVWTLMFNGHCWGCPVALAGAAMILAAAAYRFTSPVTVTRAPH